jgi:hypothetical protein
MQVRMNKQERPDGTRGYIQGIPIEVDFINQLEEQIVFHSFSGIFNLIPLFATHGFTLR